MRHLFRAAVLAVGMAVAGGGAAVAAPLAMDSGLVAHATEAGTPNVEKAYYGYRHRWGHRRFYGPRFGYRRFGWRHRHWGHRRHFGPRFYRY